MRPRDVFLAAGMLLSGTINTISSKYQDTFEVQGLTPPHKFNHPAVQTLSMFLGETLCLFAFFVASYGADRKQAYTPIDDSPPTHAKFPIWTFAIPAMCDMTGSTLMYIGLVLTYPSVYQMLRGMIVVFTGLFSWFFLKRVLSSHHFIGMASIIVGTLLVGLSSVLNTSQTGAPNPLLGDILVVVAQLVAATQMVVEEKFVGKYNVPPLQVVGNEGAWGVVVTTALLFILYWIPPIRNIDNSIDAALQIYHGHLLVVALLASIFSIAFFNYFGISVTKQLSATHRTTIDATRVFLVWIYSLVVGWEHFAWLQLGGFVVLLFGTATFNEIIRLPFLKYPPKVPVMPVNVNTENQALLKSAN